ncbi:MAG: S-methyl-5-thioribose kinase [Deltaproteobacteria bacterium]|jgi:5-methylthioribose kinase|nr:S-methyl-5-thioribose kinase [Deltaproteobacteria bacterium]
MAYRILTIAEIPKYLGSLEEMQKIFTDFNNLEVEEVGDGNLNYVFLIKNSKNPQETVVLKQAVPYLRVVGESWPLKRERMTIEIMALQKEIELCPQHVPEVYYGSHEMSLVIMENLSAHKVLRGEIIQGKVFRNFAEHISTFMAEVLFKTSDLCLDHQTKKEMVSKYINYDLCKITEDFVFTTPYEKHETNVYNPELTEEDLNFIQQDRDLKIAVAEMKYKFMNNAESLLHGDLHIGSIMVNENETYVIDPEFAFYGPMGFDVGALIGNLLMSYFSHEHRQQLLGREPYDYRKWLLDTIESVWIKFAEKFEALWIEEQLRNPQLAWNYPEGEQHFKVLRERFIARLFSDTVGFAACKMMRRILGLAKVADIAEIENLQERARIERMTLKLGKQMVIERDSIKDIAEVLNLAKELSPLV